jgi:hypothetical protein
MRWLQKANAKLQINLAGDKSAVKMKKMQQNKTTEFTPFCLWGARNATTRLQ